ncbi:MAG: DUF29 domain-containing protein [Gammaproteobacteria bacterium]|jgi:hypothetical protein|nr:DUF29 domain-containing protein [Gammaproteobacteria bacterium]
MSALSELYKTDFHAWTLKAAELIRQHRFDEVNTDDLAEELDSMGKKERNEIANRLVVLLAHLLKWQFQPAYRSTSWRSSLIEQRKQIQRQIQSSPSVKPYVPEAIDDAYPDAVDIAVRETLLGPERFPRSCPYAIDEILDFDFYPNEP